MNGDKMITADVFTTGAVIFSVLLFVLFIIYLAKKNYTKAATMFILFFMFANIALSLGVLIEGHPFLLRVAIVWALIQVMPITAIFYTAGLFEEELKKHLREEEDEQDE